MGRPAKSALEHQLCGTRDHSVKASSTFVGGRPKIPSHLCRAARAEFKRACQLLERRKTLTEGDVTVLVLYAEIYSRWVQAKAEIGASLLIEVTILDNNGMPHVTKKLNPLLKVTSDCESRLLTLAKSLGLTPTDRERSKRTADSFEEKPIPGSAADYLSKLNVVPINQPLSVPPEEMDAGGEPNDD